jgi:hypothetical protein
MSQNGFHKNKWRRIKSIHRSILKNRVLPLCLIKYHAMKTCEGEEVQLHAFLIPALDEGKRSVSRPGQFALRGRIPQYPFDRRMGFRAGLDAVVKRKNPCPFREWNPGTRSELN